MIDFIGTIFAAAAIAVSLVAIADALPLQRQGRLALAALVGIWTGLAAAVTGAGLLDNPLTVLILFALPLIAVAGLAWLSPGARAALAGLPQPLLIGLNVIRLGGVFFLLLAAAGRLAGPFPYSAGWGDVITGALALPVAFLAAGAPRRRLLVYAWNIFGTLDLVLAVMLGLFSRNGSPIQLIHAGVGSAAVTSFPWSLIPLVLVPFFLVVHVIIFAQLRAAQADAHGTSSTAHLSPAH